MSDIITITGRVGTEPTVITTGEGVMIHKFRLVSKQGWFDRKKQLWAEGSPNWYTVTSFRHLAENVQHSVRKGDLVVVTGKLRVREWERDERRGIDVEVEADAIGHDLAWGRSVFTYVARNGAGTGAMGDQAGPGGDAWASSQETEISGEGVAVAAAQVGDRPADYASNLQQPFLPDESSGTRAS